MKKRFCRILIPLSLAVSAWCADTTTQNKNITILTGSAVNEGKSDVRERVLEECIVSLPKPSELSAVVASDARYLKEINGEPARNDFTKTYSAVIDINYMLYQKVVFIVITNAVPAREPIMKEMEKNLRQTIRFESASMNGDLYAGRSARQFYFSTPDLAVADVRKKAETWLAQQTAVLCAHGKAKKNP